MKPLDMIVRSVLVEFIKQVEYRRFVTDIVLANYRIIPINCRYKIRRSEIYSGIAELARLPLASQTSYRLIKEILLELGVRSIETHGYKYFKGIVHNDTILTETHTKIIHSCGSHEFYRLPKKGKFNV